jgi:hypothetical protein
VHWPDGGTTSACAGPQPATWVFTQQDTQITTPIVGTTLGGTFYDSYDLLLTGSQVGLQYRLHAIVIPEGPSTDAGVRLEGTFTTRTVPMSGDPCEDAETFTAQRISR